jgi:hypothetical protein
MNELHARPSFYNTLTTNCTTGALIHTRVNPETPPLSWKILLSGYVPDYAYELGRIDTTRPFPELRASSERARTPPTGIPAHSASGSGSGSAAAAVTIRSEQWDRCYPTSAQAAESRVRPIRRDRRSSARPRMPARYTDRRDVDRTSLVAWFWSPHRRGGHRPRLRGRFCVYGPAFTREHVEALLGGAGATGSRRRRASAPVARPGIAGRSQVLPCDAIRRRAPPRTHHRRDRGTYRRMAPRAHPLPSPRMSTDTTALPRGGRARIFPRPQYVETGRFASASWKWVAQGRPRQIRA